MKKWLSLMLFAISGVAFAAGEAGTADTSEPNTTAADPATIEAAPPDAVEEQSGFSRGSVVRSIFTSSVQDREPVDKLSKSNAEQERVFYFTELRDMSGQTATHRWEKDGEVQAEVKFDVRGPRWRVWSSKTFMPTTAGEWKVSVLNGAGEVIAEETLNITSVPEESTAAPMETAPAEPAAEAFEPPVNEPMQQ